MSIRVLILNESNISPLTIHSRQENRLFVNPLIFSISVISLILNVTRNIPHTNNIGIRRKKFKNSGEKISGIRHTKHLLCNNIQK